jgi:transcriptional regulator with XRE-family HTH domain
MQRQPNAEAIRVTRELLGIKQAELARRAEISPSMMNKIEMGARNPSLAATARIAQALGVSLDAIAPVTAAVAS